MLNFVYLYGIVSSLLVVPCAHAGEFISLKGGTYMMGSPRAEEGRFENEIYHEETVAPFEINSTEVTQKEWLGLMPMNPAYFSTVDFCPSSYVEKMCPHFPVDGVSWEDVQTYIDKRNQLRDGYHYRLPTEAEWEYAARAGTQTAYYFGSDRSKLVEYEWYRDNSYEDSYYRQTHEVATKRPNPWGLYDMLGNVSEWVQDPYIEGNLTEGYYTVRGGSWAFGATSSRSAYRSSDEKSNRSNANGFRLVRELPR